MNVPVAEPTRGHFGYKLTRSALLPQCCFSAGGDMEGADPRSRSAKRTGYEASLDASASPSVKLGKTSGVVAVGAWAARVEIARMLEQGVPGTKILEAIRKGEEGEFPLSTADSLEPPSRPATPGSSVFTPESDQPDQPFSISGRTGPLQSSKEFKEPSMLAASPSSSFRRYSPRDSLDCCRRSARVRGIFQEACQSSV